jgi:antitoxin (DNA-binding transcriptional repressor) of toxin-antitoxin stability system
MRSVALKHLESSVGEYVRLARNGETVLITDQDRVIAELNPPRETGNPFLENAALAEAVRKGWITPATDTSDEPPPRRPVAPLEDLLRELDWDRGDR